MANGIAFGSGGNGRGARRPNAAKIAAVSVFVLLTIVAAGVPLLSRPAVVVAPVVPTPVPVVDVYMPIQRISANTPLTPLMFKREQRTLTEVARYGAQPIKSESELLARYARVVIMPGKPVMVDEVTDTPDSLLSKQIRPGFRAVTITVNSESGVEGWGVPQSLVDVAWVSHDAEEGGEQVAATIVKRARVLSVLGKTEIQPPEQQGGSGRVVADTKGGGNPGVPSGGFTVTLLVTPDDGRKILLASRTGELSLMLRGEYDTTNDIDASPAVTTRNLLEDSGANRRREEKVEGVAKAQRPDGSYEEWSVIEGRVWRWDDGKMSRNM